MFFLVAFGIWLVMHLYAGWRVGTLPWVATRVRPRLVAASFLLLFALYPIVRILRHGEAPVAVPLLERAGSLWVGALLLLVVSLLVAEGVTLGGWLFPRRAPAIRTAAVLGAAVLVSISMIQGARLPVVREYEVVLPGLPRERDGLTLVVMADLHLGVLRGDPWLSGVVDRVNALRPDVVVVAGDLVDSEEDAVEPMLPVLRRLRAPLGVWAVTGNHEVYAGLGRCVELYRAAGFRVLRDTSAQVVPGLVFAGVEDAGLRQAEGDPVQVRRALGHRPPGATVFLSHAPTAAAEAAAAGAGLMLAAHTHGGQIWPFGWLVRLRYPLLEGRYTVGGMPVIVCRGTGTWGPRMRLWRPGEVLLIRLRAEP